MPDRTPVDVILPCLDEAGARLPGRFDLDSTGWWSVVPDDDREDGTAGPDRPTAAGPRRTPGSYGRNGTGTSPR